MSTRLSEASRKNFLDIVKIDIEAIKLKVVEQVKVYWKVEREKIIQERGLDIKMKRKEDLQTQIQKLREEEKQIEDELHSDNLTVHQEIELGAKKGEYGSYNGANFFGIPVESQLDYDIVQRIKEYVDEEAPAKYLHNLASSSFREIVMAGTFEEAQEIYNDFYSLDFRKYGVDIPPRLKEIKADKKLLNERVLGLPKQRQDEEKFLR